VTEYEIRLSQTILQEYIVFFLAERQGLDLTLISDEAVKALELAVNALVSSRKPKSDEGADIAALIEQWRTLDMQANAVRRASKANAAPKTNPEAADQLDLKADGWLMNALVRRGLRRANSA